MRPYRASARSPNPGQTYQKYVPGVRRYRFPAYDQLAATENAVLAGHRLRIFRPARQSCTL